MKARRIVLWVAVVGVAAAAVLLAGSFRGGFGAPVAVAADTAGTPRPPVDLNAPTTAGSCAPCHLRIAAGQQPGVMFNHATHLQFQCAACHPANPHLGGRTATPTMQMCFNCHGVGHGPQGELATARCSDCHTPDFDLRPKSHVKDYAGAPHARELKAGGAVAVNGCMMCHNAPKDCDVCHRQKKVKVGPMPAEYHPVIIEQPQPPAVEIYPDRTTTMGQCATCHPDLDAYKKDKVLFAHADHLKRGYACSACHPDFAHQGDQIARPDMQSCYRCHGLLHSVNGQIATEKCDKCHPKSFPLEPANHTQTFVRKDHGQKALADAAYCSMCHQLKFCTDCHTGKKPAKWLPAGEKVVPSSHKLGTWRNKHGKLYLAGQGMCASCHDGPSCQRCHKTPMPHPPGWATNHKPQDIGVPKTDCNICHTDTRQCQACHHDKVKNAELIAANCVGCHPEMKQKPATAIKNKGFAEHAVHFNVAKTKGKPYRCDDCHVEIGTSAAAAQLELQQGHDLRLCYGCHGGLDYQNRQIAPYPGAELCRRCHTNLNI